MLSVQPIGVSNTSFKANSQTAKKQEQNNPNESFKTHAGLKTGAVYSGLVATMAAASGSLAKQFAETLPEEAAQSVKESNSGLLKTVPVLIGTSLAAGAFVDKMINDNRAEFDKKTAGVDKKQVLKENPDAQTSRTGQIYKQSNDGKKYGAAVGAVVLPASLKVNEYITKTKSPIGVVPYILSGAIGGLMLGAITDHFSNKGAEKHAERMELNA